MRTYTDVPVTITVDGYDMTAATNLHVTFRQGGTVVDIADADVGSATSVTLVIPQTMTAKFRDGAPVSVQINFIGADGRRRASEIATLTAEDNLLRRIIHGQ